MHSIEPNTAGDQNCGIFFFQTFENPEITLISNVNKLLKKYPNLEDVYFEMTYLLDESWLNKKQWLKVIFEFHHVQHSNELSLNSLHIAPILDNKAKTNEFGIKKDTITENFDILVFNEFKKNYEHLKLNKKCFFLGEPYVFEPVFIAKPWGKEIWFTGFEARGVSLIKPFGGEYAIPLTWLFSILPNTLLGKNKTLKDLSLVKILDPLPEEVYGDLYYEMHTEKNEVYVVTEIRSQPARIKMGINQEKFKFFSNDITKFKNCFLKAIKEYEKIRRKIDNLLDSFREKNNIALNAPILSQTVREWMTDIPKDDIHQEKIKRKEMDEYCGFLELQVGDVVCVPTFIPHALQHGVKVIEFQTPTYERMIISFAQKVLTQDHWDTEHAFEKLKLFPPEKTTLQLLNNEKGFCEELVCNFNEFKATRVKLNKNHLLSLEPINTYRLLFLVEGHLEIAKNSKALDFNTISKGECIFLSALNSYHIRTVDNATFLFCLPNS
ncbi:hypothetical protein [Spirobacillus cienkowskii]|uniref:hypothetical protein n=1 Tax=Spirobacillus cienkowskii TaxID=495820 RepID=UPI0030CE3172